MGLFNLTPTLKLTPNPKPNQTLNLCLTIMFRTSISQHWMFSTSMFRKSSLWMSNFRNSWPSASWPFNTVDLPLESLFWESTSRSWPRKRQQHEHWPPSWIPVWMIQFPFFCLEKDLALGLVQLAQSESEAFTIYGQMMLDLKKGSFCFLKKYPLLTMGYDWYCGWTPSSRCSPLIREVLFLKKIKDRFWCFSYNPLDVTEWGGVFGLDLRFEVTGALAGFCSHEDRFTTQNGFFH